MPRFRVSSAWQVPIRRLNRRREPVFTGSRLRFFIRFPPRPERRPYSRPRRAARRPQRLSSALPARRFPARRPRQSPGRTAPRYAQRTAHRAARVLAGNHRKGAIRLGILVRAAPALPRPAAEIPVPPAEPDGLEDQKLHFSGRADQISPFSGRPLFSLL